MQPRTIAQCRFDGVAERVAEIQQGAPAVGLKLVSGHHLRLDLTGAANRLRERSGITLVQRLDIGFQPVKKIPVQRNTILDDFGQPGAVFTQRQRGQRVGVDDHQFGLIKRANHVFAERMVDGGLAADRGINLG